MSIQLRISLALAVLLAPIILARPTKALTLETQDLIKNGNFETQPATDWVSVNGFPDNSEQPAAPYVGSWGAGSARGGNYSARVGYSGGYAEVVRQSIFIPENSKNIVVSFWYLKGQSSTQSSLYIFAAGQTQSCRTTAEKTASSIWRKVSCILPDGTNGRVTVDIAAYLGERSYVDDVSATAEVPEATPPIVKINGPTPSSLVYDQVVTVQGSAIDSGSGLASLSYAQDGQTKPVAVDVNGLFSFSLTLRTGVNNISLDAADKNFNHTYLSYQLTYYPRVQIMNFGLETPIAQVSRLSQSKFSIWSKGVNGIVTPFPKYSGQVWSKQITIGQEPYFIFAASQASLGGGITLYKGSGQRLQWVEPFGSFKPGYNATIGTDPVSGKVFLAVAPKKWGGTISIFELTNDKLVYVNSLRVAKKTTGNLRVSFITRRDNSLLLISAVAKKSSTKKAWVYDIPKKKFVRSIAPAAQITVKGTSVTFKE